MSPTGSPGARNRRDVEAEAKRLAADLSLAQGLLVDAERRVEELTAERDALRGAVDSITYRLGRRIQARAARMAPAGTRRGRTLRRTARAALRLSEEGPAEFARLAGRRLFHRGAPPSQPAAQPVDHVTAEYHRWLELSQPSPRDLEVMRSQSDAWPQRPLVSVIMPTFNPDAAVLAAAIESVMAQSYTNWELCIADDASTRPEVRPTLDGMAARDARIRVRYREQNGGIAASSNTALELARGEWIALLDHDDVLAPQALHRMLEHAARHPEHGLIHSDEDKLRPDGVRADAFFKPDWSPELLYSANYICHFTVIRRELVERAGGFRQGYEGSQDYDLFLRVIDLGTEVGHVPDVLYSWRMVEGSTALLLEAKPQAYDAGRHAIEDSLQRRGVAARVDVARANGRYEVRRRIVGSPSVTVIIPTRDRVDLLRACIASIGERTTYTDYRIVIVDNDSREQSTLDYLQSCGHQVVPCPGPFNYSRVVNAGVAASSGEHLLLLNNDVEVIEPQWMEAMLEHSQRPEVGAVGARLVLPDGRPQHEGVGIGMGYLAINLEHGGYFDLGRTTRNCTAVTAACMMLRREVYEELGGLDEALHVSFNDVDLCLRLRQRGYWTVYAPLAELCHRESSSRGRLRPVDDERLFMERWGGVGQLHDAFVNANVLAWHPLQLRQAAELAIPSMDAPAGTGGA